MSKIISLLIADNNPLGYTYYAECMESDTEEVENELIGKGFTIQGIDYKADDKAEIICFHRENIL